MFTETTEEQRVPLLCLDVNLGQGVAPQIVIYDGDDINQVADDFSSRYGKQPDCDLLFRPGRDEEEPAGERDERAIR